MPTYWSSHSPTHNRSSSSVQLISPSYYLSLIYAVSPSPTHSVTWPLIHCHIYWPLLPQPSASSLHTLFRSLPRPLIHWPTESFDHSLVSFKELFTHSLINTINSSTHWHSAVGTVIKLGDARSKARGLMPERDRPWGSPTSLFSGYRLLSSLG